MTSSAEFESQLREALTLLYDPDLRPSESLCVLTGCHPDDGASGVQSAILGMIDSLAPCTDTPPTARPRLLHELLHSRFVLKLTQEQTAERLHISVATAWRLQREAVHTLARSFWERQPKLGLSTDASRQEDGQPVERSPENRVAEWHAQVKRELSSLQASAPSRAADMAEVLDNVLDLAGPLTAAYNVLLEVGSVSRDLVAAAHPSVVEQILIGAVRRLARFTSSGRIVLFAGLKDGLVRVTIASAISADDRPSEKELIGGLVVPVGVSVGADIGTDSVFEWVLLPAQGGVAVLVVDDNLDVVKFYRRATQNTRYRIIHAAEERNLPEVVQAVSPGIIVLDVMLPDIDGWRLLMRLYESPATRAVPVIVCSVVKEEELALSLGAALYLQKPVRPRRFIEALDQVLAAEAAAEASRAKSETAP